MPEVDKQVHAVRLAYDNAPPYRDLEVAAVLRAAVQQCQYLIFPGLSVITAADLLDIADKLEEDGLDY